VGWSLREAGKLDPEALRQFLTTHIATMPRTTLRYAIERFDAEERRAFLARP
jgi:3-methyladenine DNA glycosylase AlkD